MFPISIAPMMGYTDRHYRRFMRGFTRYTRLYTEMLTAQALLHGDVPRLLHYSAVEHPVVLQLGGACPQKLAQAARLGADWGYDEINLNVGCPSPRVQSGAFGACLMKQPGLVAECVSAMKAAVSLPVTVKSRIGVDDQDSEAQLHDFVSQLIAARVDGLIVHARKAWLKGLSPKENREIPPLRYEVVHRLKTAFPQLWLGINGGIQSWDQVDAHLLHVDEVMLGRQAVETPELFGLADRYACASAETVYCPAALKADYLAYVASELAQGTPIRLLLRPLMGLFRGGAGAKIWRRTLGECMQHSDWRVLERAWHVSV